MPAPTAEVPAATDDPSSRRRLPLSGGPLVARVIARLNVGGPAIHVTHLTEGLASSYPTLLVTGVVGPEEGDMLPRVTERSLPLALIPELGRTVRPWHDAVALWKLIVLFRRYRPVIVHTHTAKAGTLGRIAAVLTGVPVRVHTFHGHVMRGYFSPLVTRGVIATERLLALFTTRIVTVSDSQADELANEFHICPRSKIQVIPLGLDLAPFAPARIEAVRGRFRRELALDDEPLVTIVGRLVPIKNHALFLRMAAEVVRNGRRCVFAIVGSGEEEQRLRVLAGELGIAEAVRFLGWRTDLPEIYADSDVVVLTSDNEGTPVSLIEALAAGCPVISTDVGGVRDVLDEGRLGVLVPSGDVQSFSDALDRVLNQSAEIRARAAMGAREMPSRFGVDRLLADTVRLYNLLLDTRGR